MANDPISLPLAMESREAPEVRAGLHVELFNGVVAQRGDEEPLSRRIERR
jgi:hypothetical protein